MSEKLLDKAIVRTPKSELLERLGNYEIRVALLNSALTEYATFKIRNEQERTPESRMQMLEAENALDVQRNLERAEREALTIHRIIFTQVDK